MGLQQSKEELLYQQVHNGSIEGIKALHSQGATLEWFDKEKRTPLIVACMNPQLYDVAKCLIELGANVNAYRPGAHAGTALHHAAKGGLAKTVLLLLLNGANAVALNDECQTPLNVARVKGHSNVVRTIESHICFFSGWLRELYGPGFLEAFVPQLLSRKIWVVVVPCGTRNPRKPLKLELAIYTSLQDAKPRTTITLWKAKVEEPKFNQPVPVLSIFDKATRTRYKLASSEEGEKQQLQWLCNACRGIPQVTHPTMQPHAHTPVVPRITLPSSAEDVELAMALNASLVSAMEERPPINDTHLDSGESNTNGWLSTGGPAPSEASSSGWPDEPPTDAYNGWGAPEPPTDAYNGWGAPPESADYGPIYYPSIDFSPVDMTTPSVENEEAKPSLTKEEIAASSSCVICLDAPVEGACIPCGHMAGCMSCLNKIKAKNWGCPVCRSKIDQVIRLYAV